MGTPRLIMPTRPAVLSPQPEKFVHRIMCEERMQAQDVTLVEALTSLLQKPQQLIAEEMLALRSKISEQQDELIKYRQNHDRMAAQIRAQKGRIKRILLKWADFKARSVAKGFRYITSKSDRKDGMR